MTRNIPEHIWAYDDGAHIMAFEYETDLGGAKRYVLDDGELPSETLSSKGMDSEKMAVDSGQVAVDSGQVAVFPVERERQFAAWGVSDIKYIRNLETAIRKVQAAYDISDKELKSYF